HCGTLYTSVSSLHPRQHCLGLGQPERHLHGLIEVDRRRQRGTGLLPMAGHGGQHAEALVAVGLERAHAQLLGQGEGLAVMGSGPLALRGIAMRGNVAEETHGVRLVAAFLVLMAKRQGALGESMSLLQPSGKHLRLSQEETTERLKGYSAHRNTLLYRLHE